jgi:hypothetical protein
MSKHNKLLTKARNHPEGLSFNEFKTLMSRCGWKYDRQAGSHEIWYSPKSFILSIQNRAGKAKGYQVKQFLAQYEREKIDEI